MLGEHEGSTAKEVAPFVGAWIEIFIEMDCGSIKLVAPFVGAWIEIFVAADVFTTALGRSVRRSVD